MKELTPSSSHAETLLNDSLVVSGDLLDLAIPPECVAGVTANLAVLRDHLHIVRTALARRSDTTDA